MALPIVEQLLVAIAAALAGITVSNGYVVSIASVQRYRAQGQTKLDYPLLLLKELEDEVLREVASGPDNLVQRELRLLIGILASQDFAADAREADTLANLLKADVRRCMATNAQWGGLAFDTKEIGSGELDPGEGEPDIQSTLFYAIQYEHRRADPTLGR